MRMRFVIASKSDPSDFDEADLRSKRMKHDADRLHRLVGRPEAKEADMAWRSEGVWGSTG